MLRVDWESPGIDTKMERLPVEGSQDEAELMFSVKTSAEPRCSGPLLAYVSFG